jgi:hypothetical protein
MSHLIFFSLLVIFLSKLVWNIFVPFLAEKGILQSKGRVSMAPIFEVVILVFGSAVAAFGDDFGVWSKFYVTLLVGVSCIFASYIISILVGRVARLK